MSLRDDVRWVCETADNLLAGCLPNEWPAWTTRDGEQLGWLMLLFVSKIVGETVARLKAETEVVQLEGELYGLRDTNTQLSDVVDSDDREAAFEALGGSDRSIGYYWIVDDNRQQIGYWNGEVWWSALWPGSYRMDGMGNAPLRVVSRRLRGPTLPLVTR